MFWCAGRPPALNVLEFVCHAVCRDSGMGIGYLLMVLQATSCQILEKIVCELGFSVLGQVLVFWQ